MSLCAPPLLGGGLMHTKGSAYAPNPYTGMSLCAPPLHRGGLIHPTLLQGKHSHTQTLHNPTLTQAAVGCSDAFGARTSLGHWTQEGAPTDPHIVGGGFPQTPHSPDPFWRQGFALPPRPNPEVYVGLRPSSPHYYYPSYTSVYEYMYI